MTAFPALGIGAVLGTGTWLVLRGAVRRPIPFELAVARHRRTAAGSSLTSSLTESVRPGVLVPAEDLRILSRSQGQQASHKLAGALAGVILPPFLVLGLIAAGLDVSVTWGIGLATLCCPVGFFFPDLRAREEAAERRDGFRAALASYLDLVKVLVAGGAHTDGALFQAAQVGDGWQFDELRAAIDWSRVNGHPSWVGFERLSSALNVVELSELAGSISLSDEQGASPAEALSRKAESMTIHQFAEARAKADSATEQMGVPTVLIAMAFVVFLGYPALITVVGLS